MGGGRLLGTLLLSLCVLSAVARGPAYHPRAPLFVRRDGESASASASVVDSASASASKSFSSASVSQSRSASKSLSLSSSSRRSSSETPTSSTTSVTTTTTTSSSSSSSSSSLSSSASVVSTSAKASAVLTALPSPTFTPTTTLDFSPNLATSSEEEEPTSTDSAAPKVNAASKGFWDNKGAVGGTFTVVALVIVGIIVAIAMVLRKRAASHNSARDTFFDTKGPIGGAAENPHSPNPSMVSLGNEPMDAHSTPGPNYGATDQYLVDTTDYNVSYPPGASYAPAADQTQQYYATDHTPAAQQYYSTPADPQYPQYSSAAGAAERGDSYYADNSAYENYNQYYANGTGGDGSYSVAPANHRPSLSPHPYSHPSHASGAPPSAMRDFPGRDSAYQQSIDSFYGAAGTAV
ncbi:hypothetical protein C8R43DRAFT_396729 [Mycena crocata]|nr:hypothetical protein C8R43DRAFT_396729 [Mycena crocata]